MATIYQVQSLIVNIGLAQKQLYKLSFITLLIVTGCSDIIAIERLPTPTPLPSPTPVPVSIADVPGEVAPPQTGAPVRLVADSIRLNARVVEMGWYLQEQWGQEVSVWDMPENEAAWHNNTAWPGDGGNIVISGHNASLGGQIFADIEELEIGDEIIVKTGYDEPFTYQVQEKTIIRTFAGTQESYDILQASVSPTPDERLTLITCWPRWTNTHRLIVVATPIETGKIGLSER